LVAAVQLPQTAEILYFHQSPRQVVALVEHTKLMVQTAGLVVVQAVLVAHLLVHTLVVALNPAKEM
jgi:hypothetical protein